MKYLKESNPKKPFNQDKKEKNEHEGGQEKQFFLKKKLL